MVILMPKAKCEVLLCNREATYFQSTEDKGSHAFCEKHIQEHGGLNMKGMNDMPENPKRKDSKRADKNASTDDSI